MSQTRFDSSAVPDLLAAIRRDYPLEGVLRNHGIALRRNGPGWLVASCPFPYHSDDSPSFKISLRRSNHFICFGCGSRGDVLNFIELYYGLNTLDAQLRQLTGFSLPELLTTYGASQGPLAGSQRVPQSARLTRSQAPATQERLTSVYEALISLLPLDEAHRRELLMDRHFDPDIAYQLGYRTLPVSLRARLLLCARLRKTGHSLWRIPGFYRLPASAPEGADQWCFAGTWFGNRAVIEPEAKREWHTRGLLIPTRDRTGRLVRVKIRNAPIPPSLPATLRALWPPKYMALSSAGRRGGASGTTAVHHAGRTRPPNSTLWITEGEIKADIAASILETNVLGVPGVGSDPTTILSEVNQYHPPAVVIAFDAEHKVSVTTANCRLALAGARAGLSVWIATWDSQRGKGIDNLVTNGDRPLLLTLDQWWGTVLVQSERDAILKRLTDAERHQIAPLPIPA